MFSNTFSPYLPLSVRDQVSNSNKTTDKIIAFEYFNIYVLREQTRREKF
jgi:hypothetical protein